MSNFEGIGRTIYTLFIAIFSKIWYNSLRAQIYFIIEVISLSQKTNSLESDKSSEILAVPAQRVGLAQFILSPEHRTALENRNI